MQDLSEPNDPRELHKNPGDKNSNAPLSDTSDTSDPATAMYRYRFVDVEYDEATSVLRVDSEPVQVERLPLTLLLEFLRRPNEVISRAELLAVGWDSRVTVDHVLASAINKLRKALGIMAAARLVNVPRVGYRLIGPVERVAVGRLSTTPVDLRAGQTVPGRDGYRLQHTLGNRPQKAVWLARDAQLQTLRVFKFAADGERLASLKREYTVYRVLRQELGERRDFARVLSVNFSHAPYFLECEYGGLDLVAWAAEGEHLSAMPSSERVELFLQIARAVAAAHSVGVLHKDLKPANVLIAPASLKTASKALPETESDRPSWTARLTDFGSSRLLDPTRLEALGVTAMGLTITQGATGSTSLGSTPLYLAPEVLAGQPSTTQSDLYALGLMLYQMLVGDFRRTLATGWQRDIDDPLLIEDITAATEGRSQDRLSGVAELVELLASHEQRRKDDAARALEVRRVEVAEAAARQTRARRPWVFALMASLGVGLAASLGFYAQAKSALLKAEQETARTQVINDFVNKDVLQSANVNLNGSTKIKTVFDVLQRASERASERFKGQPLTEASVRRELGEIFLRMNLITEADRQFSKAQMLLRPLVASNDPVLVATLFGSAQSWVGKFAPDESLKRLAIAELAAGPEILSAASDLAFLAARARVEVLMDAKQFKEALPTALRMVELSNNLPNADISMRFEAKQALVDLYARLGDAEKTNLLLAEIMNPPYTETNVGEVLFSRGKLQKARELIEANKYAEAEVMLLQIRETLINAFGPTEFHVGIVSSDLASVQTELGKHELATQALKNALAAFTAAAGEKHPFVAITKANLGLNEIDLNQYESGLRHLEEVRPQVEKMSAAEQLLANIDFARAKAMTYLGRGAESLEILNSLKAEKIAEGNWGPKDQVWRLQAEKGRAMIAVGQTQNGRALLAGAVDELVKLGTAPNLLADYQKLLGRPRKIATR
jgi:eukaryotic-like serine/threonine-protein kinase